MVKGCAGVSSSKLGIAFACVTGAAFASVLGALLVILIPVKNGLLLAASLAFASGVMLYISFVDMYAGKSVGHFVDAGYSPALSFAYATICLFGGFPVAYVLDKIAERLVYPGSNHHHVGDSPSLKTGSSGREISQLKATRKETTTAAISKETMPSRSCLTADPELGATAVTHDEAPASDSGDAACVSDDLTTESSEDSQKKKSALKLVHMGLLAAMAMALHNMPEGLVTFVGYMDSVFSGLSTTIAIAIHNIPEGMVIASAVYFGTGNRLKAVLLTSLAALAEPVGGLVGLAVVCGGSMTDTVFGILFGLIAGIMIYITLKELLPSARSFDPQGKVTTGFLTFGMMVMAASLIAIAFSEEQSQPVAALEEDVVAMVGDALAPASPPLGTPSP